MPIGNVFHTSRPPCRNRGTAVFFSEQDPASRMTDLHTSSPDALRRISPVPLRLKIRRLVWSIVQSTLFGCSFHTWSGWRAMLLRMFGARIGRNVTIRRTARIYYPWLFAMGDLSSLGDRAEVYNLGQITLGQRVTISQEAYLCAGSHDYTQRSMPLVTAPITIGDDAWVCARAFVGPGMTLGEGAIAAAAAVVTRDVPPWTIVGGNPAKVIKTRERPV